MNPLEVNLPSTKLASDGETLQEVQEGAWIKLNVSFREFMAKLKGPKLAVYLSILLHINDKGISFPGMETIALETGYTQREVRRMVKELEDSRLLLVTRKEGSHNIYQPSRHAAYGAGNPWTPVVSDPGEPPVPTPGTASPRVGNSQSPEVEPLGITNKKEITSSEKWMQVLQAGTKVVGLSKYPPEVQSLLGVFCEVFKFSRVPGGKQMGYWIDGARELKSACGEMGPDAIRGYYKDVLVPYMASHEGKVPFENGIQSPNTVVRSVFSYVATRGTGTPGTALKPNLPNLEELAALDD